MRLNPADFEIIREDTLPDGRIASTFRNGATAIAPPHPGGDWHERKEKALSELQYNIYRRIVAENRQKQNEGSVP